MILFKGRAHFEVLNNFIRDYKVLHIHAGAEIGVRFGDTAEVILANNPELKLYLVDPYTPYEDIYCPYTQEMQSDIELKAKQRLEKYKGAAWIKKTSVEAVKHFMRGTLDFVFIDAVHTYEHVREDIALWTPIIRNGGYLTGHDYSIEGVKKAVDEFVKATRRKMYYSGTAPDVWVVKM